MRIPNKFNGYFADGRRLYNDPATVTVTLASMEGAATAASTAAALEAAAATAGTAAALNAGAGALGTMAGTAAAPELAAVAAQAPQLTSAVAAGGLDPAVAGLDLAKQQAISQGVGTAATTAPEITTAATSTAPASGPMGIAPQANVPGAVGAAPVPPATTPPPAGLTNAATAMQGGQAGPAPGGINQLPGNMTGATQSAYAEPPAQFGQYSGIAPDTAPPPSGTGNKLLDGFNMARNFAENAYEQYRKAPMPLQALGAYSTAKSLGLFNQEQPGKEKFKPFNMSQFQGWTPNPYSSPGKTGFADGGAVGPVEQMSNMNATGANTMYPMANIGGLNYSSPMQQRPVPQNVLDVADSARLDPYTGMPTFASGGTTEDDEDKEERESARASARMKQYSHMMTPEIKDMGVSHKTEGFGIVPRSKAQMLSSPATAAQAEMSAMMKKYGIKSALPNIKDPQAGHIGDIEEAASGGIMHGLGGYSDGGRLLKGPGDGVSDSIPAVIGAKQPARLADGEFVVPARIVSELGNGSTEAGARKLYGMMDRVQRGRKKSIGKDKVAVDSKADKHLPA